MERDEIVRDLAEAAAQRLADVVETAEKRAAEIEADARREAERIVEAARAEAQEQIDKAQGAVSKLVDQADELRLAIGRLGSDIGSQAKAETPAPPEVDPDPQPPPEVDPQPPRIPEPTPPLEPEPSPPQTPEPMPPLEPEPSPPQTPEPQPPGPQISAGGASTEDLLAQLKGDAPEAAKSSPAGNGDAGSGMAERADAGDVAAARLVAMKMALDGASRDEIASHLEKNFSLTAPGELLDDVLARAKS